MNLARRLDKLEKARGDLDVDGIRTMTGEELRAYVERSIQEQGGRDAVLAALRAADMDPNTIKMVADWPAWPL